MRTRVENSEVLVAEDPIVFLKRSDIQSLKKKARQNARRRIRICTHKSITEKLHEMFIVTAKGSYVRPHKHLGKAESLHVIEGKADVVFFGEKGNVAKVVHVGDYKSGELMYYRVSTPVYHTLLVRSPTLIFHESTVGPFDRSKTVLAPWSPEDQDKAGIRQFLARLEREIKK